MMSFSKIAIGAALVGVIGLGACSPQGHGPAAGSRCRFRGPLLGGAAGNVIGRGDAASTLAGALLGGIIGGAIGADLDAQEQRLAARAEFQALDTGRPMSWRGERREVYGEVIPGPSFREGRQYCREYTHTIYIGGRPQEGYGTACREPDGIMAHRQLRLIATRRTGQRGTASSCAPLPCIPPPAKRCAETRLHSFV